MVRVRKSPGPFDHLSDEEKGSLVQLQEIGRALGYALFTTMSTAIEAPEHDTEEMFKAWDDVAGKIVIFATRED